MGKPGKGNRRLYSVMIGWIFSQLVQTKWAHESWGKWNRLRLYWGYHLSVNKCNRSCVEHVFHFSHPKNSHSAAFVLYFSLWRWGDLCKL